MRPSVVLDPPRWFWGIIDAAKGDPARLHHELEALDRDGLALFYGYLRDLATALTDRAHSAYLPPTTSDEGAFEVGAWVVTQGRDHYRAVALDPARMPRESAPGTRAERTMLGVPDAVYEELFGEGLPTDVEIIWNDDGSATAQ